MSATVRKNFVFDQKIAAHLEELAKASGKSMTALVQEMIEEAYQEIETRKKLEAAMAAAGCMTGILGNETIQEIKANRQL